MPLTVAVGSIISVEGFTFMMSPAAAGSVLKALTGHGAVPMSPGAWETLRIFQGYKPYVVALFSISDPCLFLTMGSLTLLDICRKTRSWERTH